MSPDRGRGWKAEEGREIASEVCARRVYTVDAGEKGEDRSSVRARRPRSGIIYGATCKVRKITLASAGFAGSTTLVYATGPCGSAGQRADDVYEFFSRVTYFARSPRRIISTACKREKTFSFIVRSPRDFAC